MSPYIDPRTNPSPPYRGPERPLARDETELLALIAACKEGRLYDVETWIADDRPMQLQPAPNRRASRLTTPLRVAIATGHFDLVRLLLCNGYRTELESSSPLNAVLELRRWDILDLLLSWGADPRRADVWRILDTYQSAVFDRFWAAGVDLTADGAMASALATATRNRPLYGFARAYRDRDARIRRALAVGLGAAIRERNDKAVSLCLWAGADPRRRVGDLGEDPADDNDGMTALEQAIAADTPGYLRKLGFDPARDNTEHLYPHVYGINALRALAAICPPQDWNTITVRFVSRLEISRRLSLSLTNLSEVEEVFALGGRIGPPDRYFKAELRRLLLLLDDWDAQHLFRLLSNPENLDRPVFVDLIAHEKLAARYATWPRRCGVDKALFEELAQTRAAPASIKRLARARLTRPRHVPTPPQGYWQKRKQGRGIKRQPLPPLGEQ